MRLVLLQREVILLSANAGLLRQAVFYVRLRHNGQSMLCIHIRGEVVELATRLGSNF